MLLLARGRGTVRGRQIAVVAAILLMVTAGTALMRATAIERFAEFLGLRDRVEDTRVESYAHRTLLAYIGARIWLSHPVAGVGWQASSEEWAYGPHDLGLVGLAALVGLFVVAVVAAVRGARGSPVPVVGIGWLLVAAGVWAGIGLVPGLPLDALTWLAVALVAVRG